MSFKLSTYKLIRALSPFDVYKIVTRGKFQEYLDKEKPVISELFGDVEKTWPDNTKIDSISLYISDGSCQILASRIECDRIYKEITSWNIFYNTYNTFYNDTYNKVGFNYSYECFEILYKEYKRDKILEDIIE